MVNTQLEFISSSYLEHKVIGLSVQMVSAESSWPRYYLATVKYVRVEFL